MSRYPFKVLSKVYFTKCTDADCLAAKGSVLIEVKLPSGKRVQLASTHLQATEGAGSIRMHQLAQINGMLRKYKKPGVPQILLGDLNIDSVEREFDLGLELLGMDPTDMIGPIRYTNGRKNGCYKVSGRNPEWIDHFWVDQDSRPRSFMQVKVMEFEHKGKVCPSSDHHAVEAEFDF